MATSSFKYVVLGGGNAGGYAAAEFIKRGGGKDELAIITDEPVPSYERPALSKAYLFPEGFARLPGFYACVGGGGQRQEPSWYQENGIAYLTNTKVTAVDVGTKSLKTEAGSTITYDKLIIATGARPLDLAADFKTPGADLGRVLYLRNVTDADKLIEAFKELKERKEKGKVTVVGGGYIGLETAAAASLWGFDITIIFPESRFMERLFTPEIADFYESFYAEKGIAIKKGVLAVAFEGQDGKVTHTVLKDGSKLENDLVLVGVGAKPNLELFSGQVDFLQERPGGIKVDGNLRTSNPDVYAIGDVAAFPLLKYGITTRQEHVTNARSSAVHAISSILDPSTPPYDYLPFFYSRVYNLSWQFYGWSDGTEPIFFGDKSVGKFGTYFVKEGKVVGAFLESGTPEENAAIKKLAATQPPAPSDLAALGIDFAAKL